MSDLPAVPAVSHRLPSDPDELRRIAAERLALLTPKQAAFAAAYARHGEKRRAAVSAGYSEASASKMAAQLQHHEGVASAVRALVALRSAEATLNVGEAQQLLEAMIDVSAEDFLLRNANGDLIGVRDQSLLSAPERARLKKLEAKVRRSASGRRAHLVDVRVELISALEVFDRLAKLNSWYGDEMPFAVNVLAQGETTISAGQPPLDAMWAEVLDALLSDEELRAYFKCETDDERRAILRPAVDRLKVQAA